ncbi:MAG TPA: SCO family protein [Thermoanaerobaculia bacterium]|jgi:protein SCO1/2
MASRFFRYASLLLTLVLLLGATTAFAGEHYLANIPLVDQNGRGVDLYDDLIRNHTVVINSFFASCTGSCPIMSKTFLLLQNRLGDRIGKDVILVSITVDPKNDTPDALKAYAKRMGAKPGWYFLTGTKAQVDAALTKLGQYAETRDAHKNIIIAGNDRTGLWKKALAIAPSEEVWQVVATVANDTPPAAPVVKAAPASPTGGQ